MEDKYLYALLDMEYSARFEGWDFSYITKSGRMKEDLLPWDFKNLIYKYVKNDMVMLDMGTGGGEFLSSIDNLPEKTYATESYEPNIPVAQNRLSKLGVKVIAVSDDGKLPFDDSFFDIIINRHESFSINEIKRVLKKGGVFLTQQVGGIDDLSLCMSLGTVKPDYSDWCLAKNIQDFKDSDMKILECDEFIGKSRFYDIGALVYFIKCIQQWTIPDFSVKKYFSKLKILEEYIFKKGYYDSTNHRFYLVVSHRFSMKE